MTSKHRVALVSRDTNTRHQLANYLTSVGFDVEECGELALPTAYSAVVMVAKDDIAPDSLETQVRTWIRHTKLQRVVVVTSRPAALRALLLAHAARLYVLAAPAFGWDVVDALRASGPGPLPRGA
ncbi:MAG TPA: hypothetical protein VMJ10_34995 [Kofleriaceae bacterium]|nr:hypothetical protein [Kofleriaceae bacterium]